MATLSGTALWETFNTIGTFVWDGNAWVLSSVARTTRSGDSVNAGGGNDIVDGAGGSDLIAGQSGDDVLSGGNGNDTIDGGLDSDRLSGGAGSDNLIGGNGTDILIGGMGADRLDGGSRGDFYVFAAVSQSEAAPDGSFNAAAGDVITGFTSAAEAVDLLFQDKIDLRPLVSSTGISLTFTGTAASAHGVWYANTARSTFVSVDSSGDAIADLVVQINSKETLTAADVLSDAVSPTVVGTSYGRNDGLLGVGETAKLKVRFSETVLVSGDATPTLSLNSGGTATYLSGSGANTLTFVYHVLAGQNASDLAITSLNLNGATLRDSSGNNADLTGAVSNPTRKLSVDTTAPSAPTIDLRDDSDTGRSNQDNITSDTTPVLKGTAEAFATVRILDGNTLLGTAMANAAGNWNFTTPALADGLHFFRTKALDAAGHVSPASSLLQVTVDTSPPAAPTAQLVSDTGAFNNDTITQIATLDFQGLEDGAKGEFSTDAGTTWLSIFSPIEGSNTVQVRQVDAAGNVSAANTITFTLDTTAPAAPVITGFSDDAGTIHDGITTDTTLRISGTAEPNDTVSVYDGNDLIGTANTDSAGNWHFDTAPLIYAPHVFTTKATDVAGNEATSAALQVVVSRLVFDLSAFNSAQGFKIQGTSYSFSFAGDVNGDGFDDVITGMPSGDSGGTDAGEAYLVFGSASPVTINLATLAASQGFMIQGDVAGDRAGSSVSSAGDINGDGFNDLIIGAPSKDDGSDYDGYDSGEVYVIFGKSSGFGTSVNGRQVIDLSTLSASDGFVLNRFGTSSDRSGNDYTGSSVASAGDINGDGFDDLLIQAPGAGGRGYIDLNGSGLTYVVFGTSVGGRRVVDLRTTITLSGYNGSSVASAGDVNGDGFADIMIGIPGDDSGGRNAGEVRVLFGNASGISRLTATNGFIIQGDAPEDFLGSSISTAGDVNGDGFHDLVIGAPFGNDGGGDAGEAYVVFGKESGFGTMIDGLQVIDVSLLSSVDGFIIQGDSASDRAGTIVSSAGDFNGDGIADLIVGAPGAGEAYLVFGSTCGFGDTIGGRQVLDLTTLSAQDGFIIQDNGHNGVGGDRVSAASDVNNDGFDDLMISGAGGLYVVYGGTFGHEEATASGIFTFETDWLT